MQSHAEFERICASASLGRAAAEDLVKLEQHVMTCASCWHTYHDCVRVAAHEFAAAEQDARLSRKEARECLDSELFMRRWFDRAEQEGIAFSEEARRASAEPQPKTTFLSPSLLWRHYALPCSAAAFLVLALSSVYLYRNNPSSGLGRDPEGGSAANTAKHTADLQAANHLLKVELDDLTEKIRDSDGRLQAIESSSQKLIAQERRDSVAGRDTLQAETLRLHEQLQRGQEELANMQSIASDAQRDAETQSKRANDLEATLVAAQSELNDAKTTLKDESAALKRERELLAMDRDVSDLMGARNLHILDVVDTDSRGKTRPAFGRIFFTEGKSLVFYAYDLNEAKIQNTSYQYQVWAKKEGPNRPMRRIGVFYSDNKTQNRWVFKCDDAKVVKEIDSVFVTLGRSNSDPTRPEGSPLMFAYLHGAPNHP